MIVENFLSSFWRALSVLFLYLSFVLLPIEFVNEWAYLHGVIFILFLILFLLQSWQGIKQFKWPSQRGVERRLEESNKLERGTFSVLNDRVVLGNQDLWQRFKTLIYKKIPFLKRPAFKTETAKKDPYALRLIPLLLFFILLVVSYPSTMSDLKSKMIPHVPMPVWLFPQEPVINAWIQPKDYTNKPSIVLNEDTGQPVSVPEKSQLILSISPFKKQWFLEFEEGEKIALESKSDKSNSIFSGAFDIPMSAVKVALYRKGKQLKHWQILMEEDQPPRIEMLGKPIVNNDRSIGIHALAQDDYGVESIELQIKLAQSRMIKTGPEILKFEVPVGFYNEKINGLESQLYKDLTGHIWAGDPVIMTLKATDNNQQEALSQEISFVLPKRDFLNPVAQKIISVREKLIHDYKASKLDAKKHIEYILIRPKEYQNKALIFLLLKSALSRLHFDMYDKEQQSVVNLLWDIAVTIEYGSSFQANQAFRKQQEEFLKSLSEQELNRYEREVLVEEFAKNLSEFLQKMLNDIQQKIQNGDDVFMPSEMAQVDQKAFDDLIQQLKDLAQTGSQQDLLEAMQKIQQAIENSVTPQSLSPEQIESLKQLEELQALMNQQKQILEETKKTYQSLYLTEQKEQFLKNQKKLTKQQKEISEAITSLKENLEELMPKENFDVLDPSREESRKAENALMESEFVQAMEYQQKVIELLNEGTHNIMQTIEESMQISFDPQGQGFMLNPLRSSLGRQPMRKGSGATDPLGRHFNQPDPLLEQEFPRLNQADQAMQQIRDIINELRKRSGERRRPQEERDYIDRLLKEF